MTGLRIGELCAGYGGLGMGVQAVYGGDITWVSDIDKGANKILAHRFPDVPNIGDMTGVDWGQVEPVDILCGGTPCQDLSTAGKRAGMTEGTRSNLWVAMRQAIAQLRPALVVWENVGGAYSAGATSELERDAGLLGGRPGRPALRALGRVLGDLASLGYDARWHGLRAADVGAPHGRLRVFIVAEDTERPRRRTAWDAAPRQATSGGTPAVAGRSSGMAAVGSRGEGANQRGDATCLTGALLPTPAVNDMGAAYTPETWDAWCKVQQEKHGNGNGHGKSLAIEAQRLLPTPRVGSDRTGRSAATRADSMSAPSLGQAVEIAAGTLPREFGSWDELPASWQNGAREDRWGDYAPAIACWEHTLGRPAPEPTQTSTKGNPQLSARFVEWMMGLPAGWVTDTPGITRNEALKALGNGVVPQQAAAALRVMASWEVAA